MAYRFDPFPEFETERLRLRALRREDASGILCLSTDPAANRYLPGTGPKTMADAMARVERLQHDVENGKCIFWVIAERDDPSLIGTICLWNLEPLNRRGELGYKLLPFAHGKGYMTEALVPVLEFGFRNMVLHSIYAMTDAENLASVRLLESAGFVKEGHFRDAVYYQDRFHDQVVYATLRRDQLSGSQQPSQ
jgi:ribosomal-protein-alanine N-acetyltransferase